MNQLHLIRRGARTWCGSRGDATRSIGAMTCRACAAAVIDNLRRFSAPALHGWQPGLVAIDIPTPASDDRWLRLWVEIKPTTITVYRREAAARQRRSAQGHNGTHRESVPPLREPSIGQSAAPSDHILHQARIAR